MRRIRNRTIIILSGLIVCVVAVALIVGMVKLISGIASCNSTATVPTDTVKPTSKTNIKTEGKSEIKFKTPQIEDNGAKPGYYDEDAGLYIWDKKAFELFYGSDSKAKEYAELMNSAKQKLGKDVNVYSMIIPNHTEMGLPSEYKNRHQHNDRGSFPRRI